MKRLLLIICISVLSFFYGFTQTFTGGGASISSLADSYSDITVSGLGGTDVLVSVCINITHSNDADLDIYLIDPLGNEHELSTDNGGSSNNYTGTCFTATASTNITAGSAPFTGNFIPECGTLPTGIYPNAVWTLHIYDDAILDGGDLLNWSLTFESPPCATVGFNGLPASLNCNDAAVTMYANDSATANGAIYPTIFFQYDTDDYGSSENGCRIWESSTSTLLYENLAMDDNTVLTVYATGPLFSPSETYTTEIYEAYGDGGIDLVVYDGNGTVYDTYVYPASTTGWITRGPYVPAGISSWSASGPGITATSDWGGAMFNPAVAGPGVHTITYCWDNELGCSDCASQDITVINPWDASWTSPGTICESDGTISLSALITGNTGGNWTGTGVSAGNFNPVGLSGDISITYTVGSSTSCRDIETQIITVIPLAEVFAGNDDVVCGNDNYSTSDASFGGSTSSVTWTSSGLGTFDNASNINTTYTPDASDILNGSVTLTVEASGSCESISDEIILTFAENFSFVENITICPGDSTLWQGNYYNTSGTFHANYNSVMGCDSSYHLQVILYDSPEISSVNISDIQDCENPDGSITIQATGGTPSYNYSIDNGTSFEINPGFTDLTAGTYNIVLIDQNGCKDYETVTLVDLAGTQIDSISVSDLLCYNDGTGSINIYSSDAINYSINSGMDFQTSGIFNSLDEGEYNLLIENNFHCKDSILNVVINQPDSIQTSLSISEIECYNQTGNINLSVIGGTPPYTFDWSNGGTTVNENFGPGTASVTITDNNACSLSASHVFSNPQEIIVSSNVVNETCSGVSDGSIDVSASGGTGELIYLWSAGQTSQDLDKISAGTYYLTITDDNSCEKFDTIIVISEGSAETCIEIPTAFTPNNDGKNDTWEIKNVGLVDELTIEIYNRWGQILFSYKGSGINYSEKKNQWDGTFNGADCPIGSYVYIVTMGGNKQENGVVLIKR